MKKEDKRLLVKAWVKHGRLLSEIKQLSRMSPSIAYGLIRTAEIMIDLEMVFRAREAAKTAEPK